MASLLSDIEAGEGSTRERWVRLRVLLSEYRAVLIVALVLLVAFGGWVSYGAYADPSERTERRLEHRWTTTGSVSHEAVVSEPNPVYPQGTPLENEPLYYESITPTVDGEFVGGYEARTGEDVRVELAVELVYRAVDPDGDAVYWSEREPLTTTTETDVRPGEDVTASFTVDVARIRTEIADIERELGASPGATEIVLELDRTVEGRIDGQHRSASDSYTVPITTEGAAYRLETADSYDERHEEYATETVAASGGSTWSVAGPLLALLGLAGIAAVVYVTRRFPEPTRAEREWLAYRDDRAQFDELIASVDLPDSVLEGPVAEVDSLATLAELGIDLESAVLYDSELDRYVVRDDDVRYVFDPPALETAVDRRSRGRSTAGSVLDGISIGGGSDEPTGATADRTLESTVAPGRDTGASAPGAAVEEAEPGRPDAAEPDEPEPPLERDPESGIDGEAPAADLEVDFGSASGDRDPPLDGTGSEREPDAGASDGHGVDSESESGAAPEAPVDGSDGGSSPAVDDDLEAEIDDVPVTDVTIDDDDLLALAGLEPADLTGPALFERQSGPGETSPAEADDDQQEGRSGS